MSKPQDPAMRRSNKGGATPQDSQSLKAANAAKEAAAGKRAHGTDKGEKGGGEGGGTPPAQQPERS
ncbi:hypothetical protein ABZX75_04245 [Streptomyces sp. NPDC003038]|uniref:hypothetical protein n=1 Tax=unclassified Streptomyces TaxID=2593676 RepID=UPI0033AAF77E